jgi:LmbE family N-acetylglucosaminyl deacetylase
MNVYLSPHHDDVCFSIGNLASRLGGDLVNLFTVSRYAAAALDLPADEAARVDVVSRLRRLEDEAFAKAAGLTRHGLGLREARLTGFGPFDLTNLAPEVDLLLARLIPVLLGMLASDGDPSEVGLYCPMGIGGHRNHISTLLAVRGAYDALRRRCRLFLYEDLHYASVSHVRDAGLQRAARVFGDYRLSPIVRPLGLAEAERKMQWIGLYASQHHHPPRAPEFTPASGFDNLHEIVWRVSGLDGGQA